MSKTIEDVARTAAADVAALFFASFGPALKDAMSNLGKNAPAVAAAPKAPKTNGAAKPAKAPKERKERSSPEVLKNAIAAVQGSMPAWGADRLPMGKIADLAGVDKSLASKALKKLFDTGVVAREGKAKFTTYYAPQGPAPTGDAASAPSLPPSLTPNEKRS